MEKNTAGKWIVFAFGNPSHASAGLPITGDAANITANVRIDGGAANAVDDTNPTELEDGYYIFDVTAAEVNGDNILIAPASATANVLVIGVPGSVYTRPVNFNDLSITATTGRMDLAAVAGTAQTPEDIGNTTAAILLDTNELQTNQGNFTTATGFATPTNITAGTIASVTNAVTVDTLSADTITAASIAANAIGASELAADAVTEIQSGLATSAALSTTDGKIDILDANVDIMLAGIITGAAVTGTLTTTVATTNLTGHTVDQLIGRTLTWTSGIVQDEQTDILDTDGAGQLTYTLMTLAPGNGDTFKIT